MAKQPSKTTFTYITDFLAATLRFSCLATPKILSSLRDSEHLRNSKLYIAKVQEEFLARAQLPQASLILKLSPGGNKPIGGPSKTSGIGSEPLRFHYDEAKMKTSSEGGRHRYLELAGSQGIMAQGAMFVEDLVEWLKNSKHAKKNDEGTGAGGQ